MNIKIEEYKDGIVFKNAADFNLNHIFDCGQCFRWIEENDGSYVGVYKGRAVRIFNQNEDIYIKGASACDINLWAEYFDMERDYKAIKKELSEDETLKIAVEYGSGIRILKQEPYEIVVSFIISANNRIPMIKRAVENIAKRYGDKIIFEDKEYYSFPSPEKLASASIEELDACGCGFRSPYIIETSKEIAEGRTSLEEIYKLDTDNAHKEMIKLKGIGPKVADCILLFSMQKYDAFPVDVWVKRVMQHYYLAEDVSLKKIRDFGREKFGGIAGFAQQYLFYYAREQKI